MITFSFKDVIDILLVALVLYYIYKLMKRSSAANIFSGIIVFIIVWIVFSQILNFRLMGTMMNYIINIGALALVVLFQEEIRRFLSTIGTTGKHNFIIKNEELAKTCELMMSPDYKERFKAEYVQLKNRLEGLRRMLYAWDNGKLTFTPTCPINLYEKQESAMRLYLIVLKQRAIIEGVKLDD